MDLFNNLSSSPVASRRESYKAIKPPKPFSKKDEKVSINKEEDTTILQKGKAIRRVFLIRHGQYHIDAKEGCDKTLTDTGKEQAKYTGERLKSLGLKFDSYITSTMPRAIQTGEIILQSIQQDVLRIQEKDVLLVEGAPISPEPNVSKWHPEYYVSVLSVIIDRRSYCCCCTGTS